MRQARRNGPVDAELIAARGRDVTAARVRLRLARGRASRPLDAEALRAELLAALERLAATIARAGAPLPYRLRVELDIQRRLGHRD